jgi:hypothetical protein
VPTSIPPGGETPFTVRLVEARKGETWADPGVTYIAEHSHAGRLVVKVDEEGYVTEFYVLNIR